MHKETRSLFKWVVSSYEPASRRNITECFLHTKQTECFLHKTEECLRNIAEPSQKDLRLWSIFRMLLQLLIYLGLSIIIPPMTLGTFRLHRHLAAEQG